jgi:outer membrane protein assembly factor BamB
VADELVDGRPAHIVTGLSTASGKIEVTQDVDPAGADPAALLQRTGLALDDGRVVFGMGGNDGDCASYRGRLIAVPEQGGTPTMFTVDAAADESQGAIWMGGAAPVVDSSGDIWVSAGNGSVYSYSHAYDDSDSILQLSPSLKLVQFFAPSTWAANNSSDLDMSVAPALLSDGQVILTGKSRIVYLLNRADLGGIGGQQAALGSACSQDIDGGVAVQGTTVYLPCTSGIVAVRAVKSPAALHLLWSSGTGGGPPIVAAGLVWTIGQNGVLYGLDPVTGAVRQQASIGSPANHFPTPSAADGLLLAPSADQVVAFAAAAHAPATNPSAAPSGVPASQAGSQSSAGRVLPAAAIAVGVVGCLAVIGAAFWLGRRRRT